MRNAGEIVWARRHWIVALGIVLWLGTAAPVLAGGVAIVNTVVTDNGDNDGFADSDETVTVQLTVRNTSGMALSGVTLQVIALDATRTCLTTSTIDVGDLAVDEERLTTGGFVFTVIDVDRTALGLGPFDPLSASFSVSVEAQPEAPEAYPSRLAFDLDLDITEGSGSETFLESFEDGLGTFEIQNLDSGRSNLAASDGYRCQYNDPDFPNSNSYQQGGVSDNCFLGNGAAHADAEFWGLSGPETSPLGGRGFSGFHSLFFGVDLGPPENWTTPLGTVEAAGTIDPIYIARDAASPTLTIKHQASFADSRAFSLNPRETYDRGMVMVQVADDIGHAIGPWYKIDPYQNPYDQRNAPTITNCAFDPSDDGNIEDDFFAPTNPERLYGPSSTCWPERIFANMGETSNVFDAANLGLADGPGLQGLWGIGTWIESKFDLSRFRGRPVRIRFVSSTIKGATFDDWEAIFGLNPNSGEDGWWVDDVEITGALTTAASVAVDDKDNSGLPDVTGDVDLDSVADVCDNCSLIANSDQFDSDFDAVGDVCDPCPYHPGNFDPDADFVCAELDNCPFVANADQTDVDLDGAGAACDCNDASADTYPGAVEINDGVDNNCAGDAGFGQVDEISGTAGFLTAGDTTLYSWPAQQGASRYQVARADSADFSAGCTQSVIVPTSHTDADVPALGAVYYYLVRVWAPFQADWGPADVARVVSCAP